MTDESKRRLLDAYGLSRERCYGDIADLLAPVLLEVMGKDAPMLRPMTRGAHERKDPEEWR